MMFEKWWEDNQHRFIGTHVSVAKELYEAGEQAAVKAGYHDFQSWFESEDIQKLIWVQTIREAARTSWEAARMAGRAEEALADRDQQIAYAHKLLGGNPSVHLHDKIAKLRERGVALQHEADLQREAAAQAFEAAALETEQSAEREANWQALAIEVSELTTLKIGGPSSIEALNRIGKIVDCFLGSGPQPIPAAKLPIDRPCSACSDGDTQMKYHDHEPPFRAQPIPEVKR